MSWTTIELAKIGLGMVNNFHVRWLRFEFNSNSSTISKLFILCRFILRLWYWLVLKMIIKWRILLITFFIMLFEWDAISTIFFCVDYLESINMHYIRLWNIFLWVSWLCCNYYDCVFDRPQLNCVNGPSGTRIDRPVSELSLGDKICC